MAIMLALAAALYGSADFVGGLASRRNNALVVALAAQFAGLVLLVAAPPLTRSHGLCWVRRVPVLRLGLLRRRTWLSSDRSP